MWTQCLPASRDWAHTLENPTVQPTTDGSKPRTFMTRMWGQEVGATGKARLNIYTLNEKAAVPRPSPSPQKDDFLSAGSFWERSVEVSSYDIELIYFSLQFYQFFLHVVWCSVRQFLMNWPLYHFIMYLFIPGNFFSFEICYLKLIVIPFSSD